MPKKAAGSKAAGSQPPPNLADQDAREKAQEVAGQAGGAVRPASQLPRTPAKDKPVHEVRIGRIKAVIWANQTENGLRHNVTLRRIFKRDQSSQWEQSDAFGRDDLWIVAEVARRAALWIFDNAATSQG
jgi:hypothetical protein